MRNTFNTYVLQSGVDKQAILISSLPVLCVSQVGLLKNSFYWFTEITSLLWTVKEYV